ETTGGVGIGDFGEERVGGVVDLDLRFARAGGVEVAFGVDGDAAGVVEAGEVEGGRAGMEGPRESTRGEEGQGKGKHKGTKARPNDPPRGPLLSHFLHLPGLRLSCLRPGG